LLFHFCFMLCCRFWRIKMYILKRRWSSTLDNLKLNIHI